MDEWKEEKEGKGGRGAGGWLSTRQQRRLRRETNFHPKVYLREHTHLSPSHSDRRQKELVVF